MFEFTFLTWRRRRETPQRLWRWRNGGCICINKDGSGSLQSLAMHRRIWLIWPTSSAIDRGSAMLARFARKSQRPAVIGSADNNLSSSRAPPLLSVECSNCSVGPRLRRPIWPPIAATPAQQCVRSLSLSLSPGSSSRERWPTPQPADHRGGLCFRHEIISITPLIVSNNAQSKHWCCKRAQPFWLSRSPLLPPAKQVVLAFL